MVFDYSALNRTPVKTAGMWQSDGAAHCVMCLFTYEHGDRGNRM